MKFCPSHWNALRDMVISKGMGGLISRDEVVGRTILEISLADVIEKLDPDTLPDDPLIAAWFMICGRAVWMGGVDLLGKKPGDGTVGYCPLCEAEEAGLEYNNQPGAAQSWMEGCTDSILVYCRENQLLSRAH